MVNIDFARGVALFGILVVNTAILFGPMDTLIRPLSAEDRTSVNWWVAFLVLVLFQGKFVAMFSLLFGYGLLGQIERAHASGWSATAFAFRRLGVLAVFGLVHALVFWYGDILFLYALMGGWLLLARAGFDPSAPVWVEAEVTAFRGGPWLDAQIFRTAHWLFMLVVSPLTFGWSILGMMFESGSDLS